VKRDDYLKLDLVADFVNWGSQHLNKWEKYHWVKGSARSPVFLFQAKGIEDAYAKYTWDSSWTHPESNKLITSSNAETTQSSLLSLTSGLAESIDRPELHAKYCCAVLDWGGVPTSKRFYSDDPERTVSYHRICYADPGIFVPENADDSVCAENKDMSAGITKVHALLSISPLAPGESTGLVIYDSRVAAAFNDLVAQYCQATNRSFVPPALLFSCGSARGSQRRKPNRLPSQKYPTLSTQSPGNWTRDTMRVSWLIDAMLRNKNSSAFLELPIRERFLRTQMGLFMIGYDLEEHKVEAPEIPEVTEEELTIEPRHSMTLGKGKKARDFSYTGSVVEGVNIIMGHGTIATFPAQLFTDLLNYFSGLQDVIGGFNMTDPPSGGVGEWVANNHRPLTPRHASFIAAILVGEGYCTHFHNGTAVMLRFLPY
jgi:hypothetical protein